MDTRYKTLEILLVLSLGLTAISAVPVTDRCVEEFQESLNQTMRLRERCEGAAAFTDCCQITKFSKLFTDHSIETGIYDVVTDTTDMFMLHAPSRMQARCDMKSDGGGWTVLIRRTSDVDERVSFRRNWRDYENGFGNLSTEFWYGLKHIHYLTNQESMEVQVEVKKTSGTPRVLTYGEFRIDGPDTQYTLHVSDPQQSGFDALEHHDGRKFSTAERDNDNHGSNCVNAYNSGGGWWLGACLNWSLTGSNTIIYDGAGNYVPYDYAELRVRPKSCLTKKAAATCNSE